MTMKRIAVTEAKLPNICPQEMLIIYLHTCVTCPQEIDIILQKKLRQHWKGPDLEYIENADIFN